jgi:uncharacterized RmlC-like cupin family protein
MAECKLIVPNRFYEGKQGLTYWQGVSVETVGAKGICMHYLIIPPGARAIAHMHRSHETAIFMIAGSVDTWWGDDLENHVIVKEGDHFYIPANVPHLPWNKGNQRAFCVIARTDPNEQESVVVLPDLDVFFMERGVSLRNERREQMEMSL